MGRGCIGLRLQRAEALFGGDFDGRIFYWAVVFMGGSCNKRRL